MVKVSLLPNPDEQVWKVMIPDSEKPENQEKLDRKMEEMIEKGED